MEKQVNSCILEWKIQEKLYRKYRDANIYIQKMGRI